MTSFKRMTAIAALLVLGASVPAMASAPNPKNDRILEHDRRAIEHVRQQVRNDRGD